MASQADIAYHYDVDNDFYALFLDRRYRAYSCAVWKSAQNLEDAQQDKLDRLCRYANIRSGQRVLDVGCGWGGLMQRIVDQYPGATVHGLTLSTEQHRYIRSVPNRRVSVDLLAWQHFAPSDRRFDAIVSIGAFEHFATYEDHLAHRNRDIYRSFFDWCQSVSTEESSIGLQTIVTTRAPQSRTEIRDLRYLFERVFPGSALPSVSDIQAASLDRYEIVKARRIGADYVRTLMEWKNRLTKNRELVVERYGNDLCAHYITYFDSAIRCFQSGYLDLFQASLKRVRPRGPQSVRGTS